MHPKDNKLQRSCSVVRPNRKIDASVIRIVPSPQDNNEARYSRGYIAQEELEKHKEVNNAKKNLSKLNKTEVDLAGSSEEKTKNPSKVTKTEVDLAGSSEEKPKNPSKVTKTEVDLAGSSEEKPKRDKNLTRTCSVDKPLLPKNVIFNNFDPRNGSPTRTNQKCDDRLLGSHRKFKFCLEESSDCRNKNNISVDKSSLDYSNHRETSKSNRALHSGLKIKNFADSDRL